MSLPSQFQASGPLPSATFSGWDAQTEQAALFASATASGNAAGPANAVQYSDGAGNFQGTANATVSIGGDLACQTLATVGLATIGGNASVAGTLSAPTVNVSGTLTSGVVSVPAASGSGAPALTLNAPAPSVPSLVRFTGSSILTGGGVQSPIPNGAGSLGEALSWGLGRAVGGLAIMYCWGTTTPTAYGSFLISYVPTATTNPLALGAQIVNFCSGTAGLAALGQNGGTSPVSWLITNNNATQAYNFSVIYLV